jgi:DNA (cytosine-5)-methyltransferase 1
LPCPSIFERKRPLAEKTLWRIAQGIRRFVFECPTPFIVRYNGERWRGQTPAAIVAPTLVQTGYGERPGQNPRAPGLHKPLGTLVDGQKHALVTAFLDRHFGDRGRGATYGLPLDGPVATVTARDHHSIAAVCLATYRGTSDAHVGCAGVHVAEVRAFLTAYYSTGSSHGQAVDDPMRTITARHRLGLVTVAGVDYQIVDIGLRMLQPHELLRAQFGLFAADYDLGAARTKRAQVRLIGNSVCPEVAEAVVRANVQREHRAVSPQACPLRCDCDACLNGGHDAEWRPT